jgi:hypothetical protein
MHIQVKGVALMPCSHCQTSWEGGEAPGCCLINTIKELLSVLAHHVQVPVEAILVVLRQ